MDIVDEAQAIVLEQNDCLLWYARKAAADIPVGAPGECIDCGEKSPRLVEGVCARCRDASGMG